LKPSTYTITLERPVKITPKTKLKTYAGAGIITWCTDGDSIPIPTPPETGAFLFVGGVIYMRYPALPGQTGIIPMLSPPAPVV
jgi:hypothetical protein